MADTGENSSKSGEAKVPEKKTASVLANGCYLIRYTPVDPLPDISFYEGTLRVLHLGSDGEPVDGGEVRAGGDLYCRLREFPYGRDSEKSQTLYADLAKRPDPKAGIPIFRRRDYRYYLEVTSVLEGVPAAENFTARFKVHAFDRDTAWPNPGSRTISMVKANPPAEWPNYSPPPGSPTGSTDPIYFVGDVIDEDSGQTVGTLTMGWVTSHLRTATVVIDKIQGVYAPGPAGDWAETFKKAQWEVNCQERNCFIDKLFPDRNTPEASFWTIGELHQVLMLANRYSLDSKDLSKDIILDPENPPKATNSGVQDLLDQQWLYHLLCVPRIDGFDRGVMFDTYGSDSNNVPQEAAVVAAKWDFKEFNEVKEVEEKDGIKKDVIKREEDADREKRWGSARTEGKVLQGVEPAYFRVGVHEIGHAMGLAHNYKDHGFMATTDFIADEGLDASNEAKEKIKAANEKAELFTGITLAALAAQADPAKFATIAKEINAAAQKSVYNQSTKGSPPESRTLSKVIKLNEVEAQDKVRSASAKADEALKEAETQEETSQDLPFPNNLKSALHFHIDDVNRLRFGPDVIVRPGTAFDNYGPNFADEQITRADGIDLRVSPLLEAVPLGAPVRIQLKLTNTSGVKQMVPGSSSLSLKAGIVDGRVTDPDGNERTFWPLKKCVEDDAHESLDANKGFSHTVTLLRGAQKALFPREGVHQIKVRATWKHGGTRVFVEDETSVRITPAVDDAHRAVALKIISTPDTLLSLAIGGEYFTEGNGAIDSAIHNPILKPHFAIVQAKRFMTNKPQDEDPDTKQPRIWGACKLIDDNAVLSLNEIERIQGLLEKEEEAAKAAAEAVKTMIDNLVQKIDRLLLAGAGDTVRAEVLKTKLSILKTKLSTFQNDLP